MDPNSLVTSTPSKENVPSKGLKRIILLLLVFVIVVLGAFATYKAWYKPVSPGQMYIGLSYGSESSLYSFSKEANNGKGSYMRFLIPTQMGESLHAVDLVSTDTGTYYLLRDGTTTTNVYKKTGKNVVKVTNTISTKRHLSVSSNETMLSYESTIVPEDNSELWDVTYYDIEKSAEMKSGIKATGSELAFEGSGLLYTATSTLLYTSVMGGTPIVVLNGISPQAVEFKKDGAEIFAYDQVSKSVASYSFSPVKGLSFLSAGPQLLFTPVILRFLDEELYTAHSALEGPIKKFVFTNLKTNATTSIPSNSVGAKLTTFVYE